MSATSSAFITSHWYKLYASSWHSLLYFHFIIEFLGSTIGSPPYLIPTYRSYSLQYRWSLHHYSVVCALWVGVNAGKPLTQFRIGCLRRLTQVLSPPGIQARLWRDIPGPWIRHIELYEKIKVSSLSIELELVKQGLELEWIKILPVDCSPLHQSQQGLAKEKCRLVQIRRSIILQCLFRCAGHLPSIIDNVFVQLYEKPRTWGRFLKSASSVPYRAVSLFINKAMYQFKPRSHH